MNAYGHKQSNALENNHDKYLNGVLERLDKVDPEHKNSLVREIRNMVEQVKAGKDIAWDSEGFESGIRDAWALYVDQRGMDIDFYQRQDNKANKYFTQKMAVYSYMQEMQRQAEELFNEYMIHLAQGIANVRLSFDSDIIIGGKLVPHFEPYLDKLIELVSGYPALADDEIKIRLDLSSSSPMAEGAALQVVGSFLEGTLPGFTFKDLSKETE